MNNNNNSIITPCNTFMEQVRIHSIDDRKDFFEFCEVYGISEQQFVCPFSYLPIIDVQNETLSREQIAAAGLEIISIDELVDEVKVCLERFDETTFVAINVVRGKVRLYSLTLHVGDYKIGYDWDEDDGEQHGIDILHVRNTTKPAPLRLRDDD